MLILPLLLASPVFVGAAACAGCHGEIAARQRVSHHAQALRPLSATNLAHAFTDRPLRERGGTEFTYAPAPDGGGLVARAELRGQSAEMLLEWAFGAGVQGITPVGRRQGRWIEHRISYFIRPARPDRTVGHPSASSSDAATALGLVQDEATITRCFNCHATNVGPGPDLAAIQPGVVCERCHGPGSEHVAAARPPQPARENLARTVFNAGRLPAKASVEVCAGCHRLATANLSDPASIRFQPIGLMASRCFQKSGTLSCLTCHNPHGDAIPAADDPAHYRQRCVSCHAAAHRRAENCVSCHMPRSSPLPHLEFTDHRIRVVK